MGSMPGRTSRSCSWTQGSFEKAACAMRVGLLLCAAPKTRRCEIDLQRFAASVSASCERPSSMLTRKPKPSCILYPCGSTATFIDVHQYSAHHILWARSRNFSTSIVVSSTICTLRPR